MLWMWFGFFSLMLVFLALDLLVFHRHAHVVHAKEKHAMQFVSRGKLVRCGAAILAVGLLVAFKISFNPLMGEGSPFLLLLAGIMLSAWLGGIWLGLLTTTGTALLSDFFFISPGQMLYRNSFEANFQLALFVIEGSVISWGTSTLRQALFALREADRRKDDFLAILAHELRNHLAPMQLALRGIQSVPANPDLLERARRMIQGQVQRMTRLVDDLSDLSRIRAGKIHLRREQTLLRGMVQDAVETSRPLIDRMEHELTVTLPAEPVIFEVDPGRLVQALVNLLNNAAKYTKKKGRIVLAAEKTEEEVRIRVCDSGVGIPAELLPTVFEPFTQLKGTLNRSQEGLGIGLALVRQIVEGHGGTVKAFSEGAGKGSQFLVRLPLCSKPNEPDSFAQD